MLPSTPASQWYNQLGPQLSFVAAAREIAVRGFQYLPGLDENQGIQDAGFARMAHQSSLAVCGNSIQCEIASEPHLNRQKHCLKHSGTAFGSAALRFSERRGAVKTIVCCLMLSSNNSFDFS